jgi:hypothetical protein
MYVHHELLQVRGAPSNLVTIQNYNPLPINSFGVYISNQITNQSFSMQSEWDYSTFVHILFAHAHADIKRIELVRYVKKNAKPGASRAATVGTWKQVCSTPSGRQLSNGEMKHGILSHIETFYDNAYKLVTLFVFRGGWVWVG